MGRMLISQPDPSRVSSHTNDSYFVNQLQARLLTPDTSQEQTLNNLTVNLPVPCHFCSRAFPKERSKSRESRLSVQKSKIKICERCFVCHSVALCPTCNMCPKCCVKSTCRGKTSKLLENLVLPRCRSKGSSNLEGGLYSPLPDPAISYKVPSRHKLLCQSSQEQLPVRGITSAYRQERSRISP